MAIKWSFSNSDTGNVFGGGAEFGKTGSGESRTPVIKFKDLTDPEEQEVYANKFVEVYDEEADNDDEASLAAEDALYSWRDSRSTRAQTPSLQDAWGDLLKAGGDLLSGPKNALMQAGGEVAKTLFPDPKPTIKFRDLTDPEEQQVYADAFVNVYDEKKGNDDAASVAGERALNSYREERENRAKWGDAEYDQEFMDTLSGYMDGDDFRSFAPEYQQQGLDAYRNGGTEGLVEWVNEISSMNPEDLRTSTAEKDAKAIRQRAIDAYMASDLATQYMLEHHGALPTPDVMAEQGVGLLAAQKETAQPVNESGTPSLDLIPNEKELTDPGDAVSLTHDELVNTLHEAAEAGNAEAGDLGNALAAIWEDNPDDPASNIIGRAEQVAMEYLWEKSEPKDEQGGSRTEQTKGEGIDWIGAFKEDIMRTGGNIASALWGNGNVTDEATDNYRRAQEFLRNSPVVNYLFGENNPDFTGRTAMKDFNAAMTWANVGANRLYQGIASVPENYAYAFRNVFDFGLGWTGLKSDWITENPIINLTRAVSASFGNDAEQYAASSEGVSYMSGMLQDLGMDKELADNVADSVVNMVIGSSMQNIGAILPSLAASFGAGAAAASEGAKAGGAVGRLFAGVKQSLTMPGAKETFINALGDAARTTYETLGDKATAVDYGLNFVSALFNTVLENYDGPLGNGIQKIVTGGGHFDNIITDMLTSGAGESKEEILQMVNERWWENMADILQGREPRHAMGIDTQTLMSPDALFSLADAADVAGQTFLSTLGMDVAFGAAGRYRAAVQHRLLGTATQEEIAMTDQLAMAGIAQNIVQQEQELNPSEDQQHADFEEGVNGSQTENSMEPGAESSAEQPPEVPNFNTEAPGWTQVPEQAAQQAEEQTAAQDETDVLMDLAAQQAEAALNDEGEAEELTPEEDRIRQLDALAESGNVPAELIDAAKRSGMTAVELVNNLAGQLNRPEVSGPALEGDADRRAQQAEALRRVGVPDAVVQAFQNGEMTEQEVQATLAGGQQEQTAAQPRQGNPKDMRPVRDEQGRTVSEAPKADKDEALRQMNAIRQELEDIKNSGTEVFEYDPSDITEGVQEAEETEQTRTATDADRDAAWERMQQLRAEMERAKQAGIQLTPQQVDDIIEGRQSVRIAEEETQQAQQETAEEQENRRISELEALQARGIERPMIEAAKASGQTADQLLAGLGYSERQRDEMIPKEETPEAEETAEENRRTDEPTAEQTPEETPAEENRRTDEPAEEEENKEEPAEEVTEENRRIRPENQAARPGEQRHIPDEEGRPQAEQPREAEQAKPGTQGVNGSGETGENLQDERRQGTEAEVQEMAAEAQEQPREGQQAKPGAQDVTGAGTDQNTQDNRRREEVSEPPEEERTGQQTQQTETQQTQQEQQTQTQTQTDTNAQEQQKPAQNGNVVTFAGKQGQAQQTRAATTSGGGGGSGSVRQQAAREVSRRAGIQTQEGKVGLYVRSWDPERMPSVGQLHELAVMDIWARKHGVQIEMDDRLYTSDGSTQVNGFYDYKGENGRAVVHIAQDSDRAWRTVLGHELMHLIKANNASGYGRIADVFFKYAQGAGFDVNARLAQIMRLYQKKDGGSWLGSTQEEIRRNAIEEMIANSLFDMLGDRNMIRQLCQQDQSLAQKIADWIERIRTELKELLDKYVRSHPEASVLRDQVGALDEMRREFDRALADASELKASKRAVQAVGSSGSLSRRFQVKLARATDRAAMDSAANDAAADLSREITGDKNLSHVEGIMGAALDFAVGGGTVSQSLKRYGIETRAALSADLNRGFIALGKYLQDLAERDPAAFAEMMGKAAEEDGVKYSLQDMHKLTWQQQMDLAYKQMENVKNHKKISGAHQSDIYEMQKAGTMSDYGIDIPVTLTIATLKKVYDIHGVDKDTIVAIQRSMRRPVAKIEVDDSIVLVLPETNKNGIHYIVSMEPNRYDQSVDTYDVTSIYDRANIATLYVHTDKKTHEIKPVKNVRITKYTNDADEILRIGFAQLQAPQDELNDVLQSVSHYQPIVKYSVQDKADAELPEIYRRESEVIQEQREIQKKIRAFNSDPEVMDFVKQINNASAESIDKYLEEYKALEDKYGIKSLRNREKELKAELEELRRMEDVARKNELAKAIRKSGMPEDEFFRDRAVKEFGYTPHFYDAGYILPNGKMLNFSGEKGKHFGTRGQDHRAISTIYDGTLGATESLNAFVGDGNVRIIDESPGIDVNINKELTDNQKATIRKHIQRNAQRGYTVDLTGPDGKVVKTLEYEAGVKADKVLWDIADAQTEGVNPERSIVAQFHEKYSIREGERDEEYMEAVEAGDVRNQRRIIKEAARNAGYDPDVNLYHGTKRFGFTKFNPGVIWTTTSESVAAGYAGHGRVRGTNTQYVEDHGDPAIIIRNAKNILGSDYELVNEKNTGEIRKKRMEEFKKANDKLQGPLSKMDATIFEGEMETRFWDVVGLFQYLIDEDERVFENKEYAEEMLGDRGGVLVYENAVESFDKLRDYYNEHRDEIRASSMKDVFEAMFSGYEVGDAVIEYQYSYRKLALGEGRFYNRATGSIATESELKDWINQEKNRGVYKGYGKLGDKPFVVDAGKAYWLSIKAPQIGDGYYSTDYIVEYARKNGYTSVIIKNVMDPSEVNDYGDDYVFFNSSQFKSSENVTYDNGEVIPPSKRFDAREDDMRYSIQEGSTEELTAAMKENGDAAAARELAGRILTEAGLEDSEEARGRIIAAGLQLAGGAETLAQALEMAQFAEKEAGQIRNEEALRAIGQAVMDKLTSGDAEGYEAFFREDGAQPAAEPAQPARPSKEEERAAYEAEQERVKKEAKKRRQKDEERAAKVQDAMDTIFSVTGDDKASLELEDELLKRLMAIRIRATYGANGRPAHQAGGWKKGLKVAAEALGGSIGTYYTTGQISTRLSAVYELMDDLIANGYTAHEVLAAGLNAARELTQDLYAHDVNGAAHEETRKTLRDYLRNNIGVLYLDEGDYNEIRERIGIRNFRDAMAGLLDIRLAKNVRGNVTDIANHWEDLSKQIGGEDVINTVDMLEHLYQAALNAKTPVSQLRARLTAEEMHMLSAQAMNVVAGYFTLGDKTVAQLTTVSNEQHDQLVKQAEALEDQIKAQSKEIQDQEARIERLKEAYEDQREMLSYRLQVIKELKENSAEKAELEKARTEMQEAVQASREAQRKQKEAEKELKKARDRRDEIRKELREANRKLTAAEDNNSELLRQNERMGRLVDNLQDTIARQKRSAEKAAERAKKGLARQRITDQIRTQGAKLRKMLQQPGNKNGFVPTDLMKTTAALVDALIAGDGRKSAAAGKKLSRQLLEAKTSNNYDEQTMFDAGTQELVEAAINILENKAAVKQTTQNGQRTIWGLRTLSDEDLQLVANAVTNVVTQVENAGQIIGEAQKAYVRDEAVDAIRHLDSHKRNQDRLRVLKKFLQEHLTPERFFNMLSNHADNAISRMGNWLKNGQRKAEMLTMQASKLFQPLTEGANAKKYDKFTGKNAVWYDTGIHVLNKDGSESQRTMRLTGALRASLLMNWTCEENREGMKTGERVGNADIFQLTMPDEKLLTQGKTKEAYQRGYRVYLTAQQIGQILDEATDYEKQWCAAWRKAEKEIFQPAINQTSLTLYGYYIANVEDYYPISRDPGFIGKDFDSVVSDERLTSMGFTKARVNAHNPMMLLDIANVTSTQIRNVSKYAGLAVPIRNFMKVYNANLSQYSDSVKKALARDAGPDVIQYIEKLISDMQGGATMETSFLDRLRGKQAAAVLTGNVSVIVKQAASYPTAAATLGYKALLKAVRYFMTPRQISTELMDTYCPAHWMRRSQSLADLEANANRSTALAKALHKLGNGIQGADVLTTKVLWKAAEFWVEENTSLRPGSQESVKAGTDEFYKAVAEKYMETLEQTQPEYGQYQRPGVLRSKNAVVKSMTMFMTQRIQNFNILADSVMKLGDMKEALKADPKSAEAKQNYAKAKTDVAVAVSSQIMAAAMIAVLTALGKALTHKMGDYKDEKGDMTPEAVGRQLMKDGISSMAGIVVGGSELFDLISGLIEGKAPFDIEAGGVSTINDLYQNVFNLANAASVIGDDNTPWDQKLEKLKPKFWKFAGSIAELLGVPLNNVRNLVDGIAANTKDFIVGAPGSFQESGLAFLGSAQGRDVANKNVVPYIADAMARGDTAEVERLYNEQIRQGKTTDSINTALATYMKQNNPAIREAAEAIEAGDIGTYNDKINEITETGVSMADAVKWVEAERKKLTGPSEEETEQAQEAGRRMTYDEIVAGMTKESDAKTYGSGYTNGMMNSLLEDGHITEALAVREAMLKSGKAEQSIRSSLTSYWKERLIAAYEAGNEEQVRQWINMLVQMGMNRSTVQGWLSPKTSSSKSTGFGSSKGFGSSSSKKSGFGSGGFGSGSFGSGSFGSSTKKKSSKKKNRYW